MSEWVSIKDKLPEVGTVVLVWRRELRTAKRVMVGDTALWYFYGETHYTYEEPTHWQPMPDPPKVK